MVRHSLAVVLETMKFQIALLPLLLVVPLALTSCQTNTSGQPDDVGLSSTQFGADAKEFKDNDGYVVGMPVLIVASGSAEIGATGIGLVESTGKALQNAGRSSGKAWDWWINEAPKK